MFPKFIKHFPGFIFLLLRVSHVNKGNVFIPPTLNLTLFLVKKDLFILLIAMLGGLLGSHPFWVFVAISFFSMTSLAFHGSLLIDHTSILSCVHQCL